MPASAAWLTLPTYNEADNLERLVVRAREVLGGLDLDAQILVVDDASPDGTGAIADRLAAAHPDVHVLHRTAKDGLGRAYVAGFAHALGAGAELLLQMDSDLSHDPAELRGLLARAQAGADVVVGSRYVAGGSVTDWGPVRRAISRGGCLYARSVLGVPIHDLTGGMKCWRREVLESIDLPTVHSQGYGFQIETTYRALRAGFRVEEVPITFRDRTVGQSKMTPRIALEALWRVPLLRYRERAWLAPEQLDGRDREAPVEA
jgi:dolichol-phosphate mannosyltransferase